MNCLILKNDIRYARLTEEYLIDKGFKEVKVVEGLGILKKLSLSLNFDFAVIDFSYFKQDGFELSRLLKKKFPNINTILCIDPELFELEFLLRFDINGYISLNHSFNELLNCFLLLKDGYRYICHEIREKLSAMELPSADITPEQTICLTKQERKILHLLKIGKKTSEIASELFLSINTINNHKTKIKNKLQLKSNRDLLFFALNNGLPQL
jgi:DNA-binding NarL/FixJ family response regulator